MLTLDAIYQRRSVKNFDPSHKISAEDEKKLFEAAQQTPSSFNIQHWRFVNVKDADLREKIKEAAWGQPQITEASLLLVLCADVKAHAKEPERYWGDAPEDVKKIQAPKISKFYEDDDQLARDEGMRSVGLIAQTIMLAAKALGLDSCPMIGFDQKQVAKLINMPEDHAIGMIITIGKAAKTAFPKAGMLKLSEIVTVDRF